VASAAQLEKVIERIREARNFDFRSYKRATLIRRIERRMDELGTRTVRDYLKLLERAPEEYDALISSMLIKVTSFFRDPETWNALAKLLPEMVARKAPGDEIRVWSVGCATGEEAYSAAILLSEALGPALGKYQVKVFGTDVDAGAVVAARQGVYGRKQLDGITKERRARFFTAVPGGYAVSKELRRLVVFGVNNVVGDAPISRLDLLLCRNVFIYLDAPLQRRILARFHYGLRPGGVLVLGRSELIPFAAKLFEPIDLSRRIYRRAAVDGVRAAEVFVGEREQRDVATALREGKAELSALAQFHRHALDAIGVPVFTTTPDGAVTSWNGAAAALWGPNENDVVGKRVASLGLPGLAGDLLVEKTLAVRDGRAERRTSQGVVGTDEARRVIELEVVAVRDETGELQGLAYVALDVTAARAMEEQVRLARDERQKAVEDLQTTNEELQSSNEELETTNEELQSANEELQTTNEELQSSNEELETTNEELQSTNAELDATNRELARRTEELNLLTFYHRTIIRSVSAAVIVLDTGGRITLWNLAAERLLGITEAEAVGQLLWTLRVPIITREMARRIQRSLASKIAYRVDDIPSGRAGGGASHSALSAVPLVEDGRYVGAVVILEDTTRAVQVAEERVRHELARGAGRRSKEDAG
jgi:two-component system CheB/CheR fusion protein